MLFDHLDVENTGEIGKDEFLQGIKRIEGYKDNKDLVQECVEESFLMIQKCFGYQKITPEILYLMYRIYK